MVSGTSHASNHDGTWISDFSTFKTQVYQGFSQLAKFQSSYSKGLEHSPN